MTDIGYAAAFLGGLLALLSPCSALLLPAFFAYSFSNPVRLMNRTALFYAGLCVTLIPLGVAGSFASRLFYGNRDLLIAVGGWTVIALGVMQALGLGFGSRRMQQAAGRVRPGSGPSVVALGAVYGLAGFCAGPILGGILTIAAVHGSPWYGGTLLAVYALGMTLPLFVMALLWKRFELGSRRWLRGRPVTVGRLTLHSTSLLTGLMFVLLGSVFLLFDGTSALPGLLSVETEFALEEVITRAGGAVPDALLLGLPAVAALLTAGAVAFRRSVRKPRRDEEAPTRAEG
ncbi:cytochrome c biogenesis CcdA family protein [Streptomyces meridianus]|uniref:Cytochrome c biogenesis CcdA family protein n=1 Tax=Streptomyces meridianus TaxID=2938945 RepID=A0ABT0X7C7_9ACTN|nr:cytochrome c biogenesis CcdA family protein [Streptomyces meridianus]MCM2578431.1 cytochrome c biogenesis CcdA family protein [Streptomyces meridianus]